MTVRDSVNWWKAATGTERSLAQSHFNDLCAVLDKPAPSSDVPQNRYAFEKSVLKTGGQGFAPSISDAARLFMQGRAASLNLPDAAVCAAYAPDFSDDDLLGLNLQRAG